MSVMTYRLEPPPPETSLPPSRSAPAEGKARCAHRGGKAWARRQHADMGRKSRETVRWEELAREVGSLKEDGSGEYFSSRGIGDRALGLLLGMDVLLSAVECCLEFRPGWLVAESMLRATRMEEVLEHCRRLAFEDPDLDRRARAVRLIKEMADPHVVPWVHEFLRIPGFGHAIDIIERLLHWGEMEASAAVEEFAYLESHEDAFVRDKLQEFRGFAEHEARANQPASRECLLKLGQKVRDMRQKAGLSIRVLAGRVGCSPNHLSRFERGVSRHVSRTEVASLGAELYGKEVGEFLGLLGQLPNG